MNPSPVNCGALPPYRCTSASAVSMNQRINSCIASAPRRSVMMVESTTSQNSTVTCFNSPSPPGRNGTDRLWALAGRAAPHWPQNLLPAGLSVWQLWHETSSGAAQWPQNLITAEFSAWHSGHVIPCLPMFAQDEAGHLVIRPGYLLVESYTTVTPGAGFSIEM